MGGEPKKWRMSSPFRSITLSGGGSRGLHFGCLCTSDSVRCRQPNSVRASVLRRTAIDFFVINGPKVREFLDTNFGSRLVAALVGGVVAANFTASYR
jgi:hypothetical protein